MTPGAETTVDEHDLSLLDECLMLTVDERVQRLVDYVAFVQAAQAAMRAADAQE